MNNFKDVVGFDRQQILSFLKQHGINVGEELPNTEAQNKPLSRKEQNTYLLIIDALCHHAKIDISKPRAAGETIESMSQLNGAKVDAKTIENKLKLIPNAKINRGSDK